MQINQSSSKAIINWQGYSIAANEAVRYLQPGASSIALNRVIGLDPSYIYGLLSANGQVWVINPNGLLVGPNAKIETGSFLGSTLNISDQNFLTGNYTFTNSGSSSLASILNNGKIIASHGGYVALLSPSVTNEGTIVAKAGTVALASGDEVTLSFAGNKLVNLVIDAVTKDALGISNSGTITANGGTVLLTARTASDILKNVVNNTGIIEARSLVRKEGQIILDGGDAGIVANSGTLDVSSAVAGAKGGSIGMFGKYVGLFDGAKVNASGDAGGGTILIGGNFHGAGPEQNASMTYVGSGATISADAITSGNGGNVAVWSNDATKFYGNISAKGGTQGGDGGFVEVSGKTYLDFAGLVNTLAPIGKTGTLLLDPTEISIEHGGNGTDTNITTSAAPFINTSAGAGSILMDGTINTQLGTSGVTVTTSTNDIVVDNSAGTVAIAPAGGSNSNPLTLNSAANISWNASWSYTNSGQLTLHAGGGTISGTGALNIGGSSPLLMQAASGIGSSGTPVATTGVTSLAATAGTGGIYISNSGSGDITIDALTNPVTSSTVNGLSTTTSGDIQLNNSSGSIALGSATGAAIDTSAGSGAISLSGTSIGTHASPVTFSEGTGNLNLTASTGGIYVNQVAGDLATSQITTLSAGTGQAIEITDSAGKITVDNATDAGGSTLLLATTTTGKDIDFSAATSKLTSSAGVADSVKLVSAGAITNSGSATKAIDTSTGNGTITLSGTTIGTSGNPITVSTGTGTVSANTSGSGDAYVTGDALNFGASNVGGTLTVATTTGGISQTGGITAGTLVVTNTTGSTTLDQSNAVTNLGAVTSAGHDFTFVNAGALNLTGAINTTGTAANSGHVSITTGGALAVNNSITTTGADNAGGTGFTGGNVSLITTAGGITTAGAGSITTSGGNATGGTNNGGNAGSVTFKSNNTAVSLSGDIVALGGAGFGGGAEGTAGVVALGTGAGANSVGSVTQSAGSIQAGTLWVHSGGGVTLNSATNAISNLGAMNSTGGAFSLTNTVPLTVNDTFDATGQNVGINDGNNTLTFTANTFKANDVTLTASTLTNLDLPTLTLTGAFTAKPSDATSTIGLAGGTGTFALTAAEISNIKGTAATSFTIGASGGSGALGMGADVDFSGKTLTINSGRINDGTDSILANNLTLNVNSTAANTVKTNAAALAVDTTAGAGKDMTVTDTGGVALGTVNVGTGTFNLTTAGAVTETGAMTAGTLVLNTGGNNSATLDNAGNAISVLGDSVLGGVNVGNATFTLVDTVAVTQPSSGTAPITAGTLVLTDTAGGSSSPTNLSTQTNNIAHLGTINTGTNSFWLKDDSTGTAGYLDQTGAITANALTIINTWGNTNLGSQNNNIPIIGHIVATGNAFTLNDVHAGSIQNTTTTSCPIIANTFSLISPNASVNLSVLDTGSNHQPNQISNLGNITVGGAGNFSLYNTVSLGEAAGAVITVPGTFNFYNTTAGKSTSLSNSGNLISNLGTITSTGGDFILKNNTALGINGAVNASGHEFAVKNQANDITLAGTASINADTLLLRASNIVNFGGMGTLTVNNAILESYDQTLPISLGGGFERVLP